MRLVAMGLLALGAGCFDGPQICDGTQPLESGCAIVECETPTSHYYCPSSYRCVPKTDSCEKEALVAECTDGNLTDFASCTYANEDMTTPGSCLGGVCDPCDFDQAGCTFDAWVPMTSQTNAPLYAVWAASSSSVFAVGDNVLLEYDGTRWAPFTMTGMFRGVWGTSRTNVYAVSDTQIVHYDGMSWTSVATSAVSLKGVGGADADHVIAVGENSVTNRYNGTSWVESPTDLNSNIPILYGVSSRAAGDIVVVGSGGVIERYGTAWSNETSGVAAPLRAVWSSAALEVAVGDDRPALNALTLVENTGSGWTEFGQGFGSGVDFLGVWGKGMDAFACGQNGNILRRANGSWTVAATLPFGELRAVSGTAVDNVFVVGIGGGIYHYTGR